MPRTFHNSIMNLAKIDALASRTGTTIREKNFPTGQIFQKGISASVKYETGRDQSNAIFGSRVVAKWQNVLGLEMQDAEDGAFCSCVKEGQRVDWRRISIWFQLELRLRITTKEKYVAWFISGEAKTTY
jgi:hypothetical protein